METSVFKEILFHSINGSKIYDGTIDWLEGLETHSLIVRSSGGYDGLGSIDGSAFNIGNNVPINFVGAVTVNTNSLTAGAILLSGDMELIGDLDFGGNSLNDFYSNYVATKSVVDSMVADNINTIPSYAVAQLINLTAPWAISTTKWSYLNKMQNVASGENVTFGSITATTLNITSSFITALNAVITGKSFLVPDGTNNWGISDTGNIKGYALNINDLASINNSGWGKFVYLNINDLASINGNGVIAAKSISISNGALGVIGTTGDISSQAIISAIYGYKTSTTSAATVQSPPGTYNQDAGDYSAGTVHAIISSSTKIYTTKIKTTSIVLLTPKYNSITTAATAWVVQKNDDTFFEIGVSVTCDVDWIIINKTS